ncbi:MAG: glycoside hydrolase family 16 protein [Roseibium sp.]|uniref:glycoside hydrolase family 16 protein n=1 Tax=Roseibium sp. TaxID=1936156 RepID=UPI0026089B44|nr:glycoside hydrolase family 16 protein [Roseibium sp.]MCV0425189.1 glycoside hydrolase family 16 protein [Roseibium sp.]
MAQDTGKAVAIDRRRFLRTAAGGLASAGFLATSGRLSALSSVDLPVPLSQMEGIWQPTFEDNFFDLGRFHQNWERMRKGGHGHFTMRYPRNVVVDHGEVDLLLGHQSDPDRPFTGGYIRTRNFRQLYGYFECEMRIASEAGVNNAFWMISDKRTAGETHFELDVAEVKYPNIVQVSVRRWRPEKKVLASRYRSSTRLDDTFHRYAMLWTEKSFRFYVDDLEVFEAENEFAHTPAMLLLSNAVAPFAGKNDGSVVGAATTIRNVRAFQDFS